MEVGVAVIGTGFMGQCHARAWHAVGTVFDDLPAARLALICDVDVGQAVRAAARYGVRGTDDWRAALADDAVQAVSITTPNAMHAPMALAALALGKHIWCEKPMATTLADSARLAQAAEAARGAGVVASLGYNYLRNPAFEHAARLVAEGAIGRLVHVRGAIDEDYAANAALPWSWRDSRSQAGLGVLGDLMSHLVAMVQRLAGPIARVCGDNATAHESRTATDGSRRAVENEDMAQALVRFASGATGVLAASRIAWGCKNRIAVELHGTEGTIGFDQERMGELRIHDRSGTDATRGFRTVLTGPLHPPYGQFCPAPGHGIGFNDLKVIEAAQFLRAIQGSGLPPTSFAEGLAIERVLHAIAAGGWIDL